MSGISLLGAQLGLDHLFCLCIARLASCMQYSEQSLNRAKKPHVGFWAA